MILQLSENGRPLGAFPVDPPERLARQSQVIKTTLGVVITIRPADKPRVFDFRVIGQKPGSQVVEEIGRMKMGEFFNIPAGTTILKIERIREGE